MSATPPPAPDAAAFRGLMARWATGVAVVTARDGDRDAGLTVNALLSVSLTPPSLLVSLTQDADTTPVIDRSRAFAVNFLAADQRAVSEQFARTLPPAEKFRGIGFHRGRTGAPLLEGTLGAAECRVAGWHPQYDHVLIVGEVIAEELGRPEAPLLYFRSGYAEPEPDGRLRLPPARR